MNQDMFGISDPGPPPPVQWRGFIAQINDDNDESIRYFLVTEAIKTLCTLDMAITQQIDKIAQHFAGVPVSPPVATTYAAIDMALRMFSESLNTLDSFIGTLYDDHLEDGALTRWVTDSFLNTVSVQATEALMDSATARRLLSDMENMKPEDFIDLTDKEGHK